ncbi:MAG: hypothetical protein A2Y94_02240 [Caldithrix sp. RBG_13_44_9]|nr:MAG: hypothetical protein A2Y94_02240 [Caldithrix sp. RBG_13_44_9]
MMDQNQQDFYQKLRAQIISWISQKSNQNQRWAKYILLAPDLFHLLCKLMLEVEVPPSKKIKLAAVIAYFISPLDFFPEGFFGPVGYLDDIALTAYVLNDLINEIDPGIVSRHWAGDGDILNLLKTILLNSDKMLGSGLWKKIRQKIL